MNKLSKKGNTVYVAFIIFWYVFSYFIGGKVGSVIEDNYSA